MDKRYGSIYVDKHNDGTKDLSRHKKDSFYGYKDVITLNIIKIIFGLKIVL